MTFKTTKYLKGCTKQHRNNLIKTSEKLGYLVLTQYIDTVWYAPFLEFVFKYFSPKCTKPVPSKATLYHKKYLLQRSQDMSGSCTS